MDVLFLLHVSLKGFADFEKESTQLYQPPEVNPITEAEAGAASAAAPPMPHPVLSSGKIFTFRNIKCVFGAKRLDSSRRRTKEPDDVLVLCRILHRALRRTAESEREPEGKLVICRHYQR